MKYPISKKRLWIDCIHYVSESILAGDNRFISNSPQKGVTIIAVPFGWCLSRYIKYKAKSIENK